MGDDLHHDLSDLIERFDHVSMAVWDIARASAVIALTGGSLKDGGDNLEKAFRWVQFDLPGNAKLEMIQPLDPSDPGNFLTRFLNERGEGLHHLTFKVTSLGAAIERAEALGHWVVGRDESAANWKEAFVHPKSSHGTLIQLAEWTDLDDPPDLTLDDVTNGVLDRYL